MKKINQFIILAILFVFIGGISVKKNKVYATNIIESKFFSNATLEDEFADDRVLIILNEEASLNSKRYDISDFPNIRCTNVKELTIKDINQIRSISNSEAKRVLSIELENSSKSYVLYVINELIKRDDVLYVGPDYEISVASAPYNVETDIGQWAIDDLQLPLAWNFTTGSKDVVVGVIDTGIEETHSALETLIKKDLCKYFNNGESNEDDLCDYLGHGTNSAGVIGTIGNNIGCIGVNRNVSIVSLKVTNKHGSAFSSNVAEAIEYAEKNNIFILNLSLAWKHNSSMYDKPLEEIIKSYSGLVICGAGNDGVDNDGNNPSYPSSYALDNIISVGAYDQNHDRAIWNQSESSNYGINSVDIYAPGSNIYTTFLNDGYNNANGTSIAAPYVTGVAALLLSLNKNLTPTQLKEAILNSADTIKIDIPDIIDNAEFNDKIHQNVLKLNGYNAVKYVLKHFLNNEYTLSNYNYIINTNKTIISEESYFDNKNAFYKLNVDDTMEYEFEISSNKKLNVVLYNNDFTEIDYIDLDNLNIRTHFITNLIKGTYYLRAYYDDDNLGIISTSIKQHCKGCNSDFYDRVILNCQTKPYEDSLYLQQNQALIYELDLECDARYDFKVESPNLLNVELYDENMILIADFFNYQKTDNNYRHFIIKDLEKGKYHIKINLLNGSTSCNINLKFDHTATSTKEILVNEPVDVLEHLHYNKNVFYFMRNKPGIYEVVLTGLTSSGTIVYPEGTITITNDDNIVQKYVFSKEEYDNLADSLYESNTMTWLVDDYIRYYINIDINSTGLTSLQLEVRELESFILSASDEYSETSLLINGDKFEELNVDRTGEYNIKATYNGNQTEYMLFAILRKICDGSFEEIDGGIINDIVYFETDVVLNTGEQIYIGYFNGKGNGTLSINIERNVSNTFLLVTDPNSNVTVGSEVSLNNGEYGGTTLTQGYTRIVYLGINAPYIESRTQYNWYTTDSNVAIVSSYGTVTATAIWTGNETFKTVKIRAVYKKDITIVGEIELTVYKDPSVNSIAKKILYYYGMDVRGDGSTGTEVSLNNGSEIEIAYMPEVIIGKGYTRYICLGSDSPSNIIQHFNWTIARQTNEIGNASVSQYGTITAISEGYITVKGVYKYNAQYEIYIRIKVE